MGFGFLDLGSLDFLDHAPLSSPLLSLHYTPESIVFHYHCVRRQSEPVYSIMINLVRFPEVIIKLFYKEDRYFHSHSPCIDGPFLDGVVTRIPFWCYGLPKESDLSLGERLEWACICAWLKLLCLSRSARAAGENANHFLTISIPGLQTEFTDLFFFSPPRTRHSTSVLNIKKGKNRLLNSKKRVGEGEGARQQSHTHQQYIETQANEAFVTVIGSICLTVNRTVITIINVNSMGLVTQDCVKVPDGSPLKSQLQKPLMWIVNDAETSMIFHQR